MNPYDKKLLDWQKQRVKVSNAISQGDKRYAIGLNFILELMSETTKRLNIVKSLAEVITQM